LLLVAAVFAVFLLVFLLAEAIAVPLFDDPRC
jgi:hypothetical protein